LIAFIPALFFIYYVLIPKYGDEGGERLNSKNRPKEKIRRRSSGSYD